jgi:flagellar motor switch protein FliN/FliY
MSKTSPKAELDAPDEQLDRAIEELRGVLKEEERRSDSASDAGAGAGAGADPSGSVIMNIPVEVQIVLGSAEMPVSELMALQKGSTVALNRRIGEPVDIVVNGRHIARGEITVLESDPSRFGIRLTEVIAAPRGR